MRALVIAKASGVPARKRDALSRLVRRFRGAPPRRPAPRQCRLALEALETRWNPGQVRVVYLTPSDKVYKPEYEQALTRAVTDLQGWFPGQLNGYTFTAPSDPVVWYQTSHPTSWYRTNPSSPSFYAGRFWESALDDGFALTGGRFNDTNNRWLFYLDADPLPGQYSGGTSGVALMGANDLRGLNGEPLVAINPGDPTANPGFNRWVGGMGHEMGHAFLLPHPPDSPGGPDDWCLMYYGYLNFPNTYLRPSEKTALLGSFSSFFTRVLPPTVAGVQVDNGAAQRSLVRSLTVTFSGPVSFPNGIGAAFQLTRTGPGGPTGAVNLSAIPSGNTVIIAFTSGGSVGTDPGGSLADGVYRLAVVASQVQGAGGALDGDGNGTPGGDYALALHRLYGDGNGDRRVDNADFFQFRSTFGRSSSDPLYLAFFDANGDGRVDNADFFQFRARFGTTPP
jgi:hypothetical protein